MANKYNLKNIRALLVNGFSETELRDFCFYESDFEDVYNQLPQQGTGKDVIVQLLLDYAKRKSLIEDLLIWAKEHNPAMHEKYQPYCNITISPATPSSVRGKPPRAELQNKLVHTSIDDESLAGEYFNKAIQAWVSGNLWEALRYFRMTLWENQFYPLAEQHLESVTQRLLDEGYAIPSYLFGDYGLHKAPSRTGSTVRRQIKFALGEIKEFQPYRTVPLPKPKDRIH